MSEWDHEIKCSWIHIHIHIRHGTIESHKERVIEINKQHPGKELTSMSVSGEDKPDIIPHDGFSSCSRLVSQDNGWNPFGATCESSVNVHTVGSVSEIVCV